MSETDSETLSKLLTEVIVQVPDYPKPGILFHDVTSLLENPIAFSRVIDAFAKHYADKNITKIVGTESRGFIFGAPLAYALKIPFIPVRKPKKLPRETISESYSLEYGKDTLEIHVSSISNGDQVLMVDDLLATGGTLTATAKLIGRLGGTVIGAAIVIELPDLGGGKKLQELGIDLFSLVQFNGD